MTWEESAPHRCGICGTADRTLFHIPGGWPALDPREGLCEECGRIEGNPQHEVFQAHFGEIRYVSDTDSVSARDRTPSPPPTA